jgi:hypothetical protein
MGKRTTSISEPDSSSLRVRSLSWLVSYSTRTAARGSTEVDITHSEHVEKELDLLISRRHDKRVKDEGERLEEELWKESERHHEAQRRMEMCLLWLDYHREAANRARRTLEALIARHEAATEMLENEYHKKGP